VTTVYSMFRCYFLCKISSAVWILERYS
jgi:hypothetical protein